MYVYPYCNALSARFFAVDRALNSYFMIMIMCSTLFPPCLVNIYEQHCSFLHRLECRLASQHPCFLGDIFDVFIPSSDVGCSYLFYLSNIVVPYCFPSEH